MALARIQITQGGTVGVSGQSVLGLVPNTAITLTDDGGAGATSYSWSIVSWPSPLSAPPTITNATSQVATISIPGSGFKDGAYIVKLIRVDNASGTTVDVRFFGIMDEDGLILPSAGQSGNLSNTGVTPALAIAAGWAGRDDATSNVQLDAYLRFLKGRLGRWVGNVFRFTHTSSSPTTVTYVDGVDRAYRILTLAGIGLYTEQLTKPAIATGKTVRYLVTVPLLSGGFAIKNGVSGSTLLSIVAPSVAPLTYDIELVFDGTDWVLVRSMTITSSTAGGSAGGDLGDTFPNPTVLKINGASVPFAGSLTTGHLLKVSGTSALSYGFLTDANVATGAAIAGAKISPDFGSQNVVTTGNLQGTKIVLTAGGPTLTKGAGTPSASEPNGSIYTQTNGTDGGSVWVRQGGTWYLVGGALSGVAGGDLGGSYPNPTVGALKGITAPVSGPSAAGQFLKSTSTTQLGYSALTVSDLPAAPADGLHKIWWVGDSITDGTASPAGARERAWRNLRLTRGDLSFVGSRISGGSPKQVLGEWEHDGVAGARIQDVDLGGTYDFSTALAKIATPTIGVISLGVNNSADTYTAALARLTALMGHLATASQTTTWIITDIVPIQTNLAWSDGFNAGLPAAVAAMGSKFVYLPAYGDLTIADQYSSSNVHPIDSGMTIAGDRIAAQIARMLPPASGLPYPRPFRGRGTTWAAWFTSNTQAVTISGNSAVDTGAGRWYFSTTVQPSSLPSGNNVIAAQGGTLGNSWILCQTGNDLVLFWAGGPVATWVGAFPDTATSHHIAIHADPAWPGGGLGRLSLWVDGVLGAVADVATTVVTATGTARFGNWSGIATGFLGTIDSVSFNKGTAVPDYKHVRDAIEKECFEGKPLPGRVAYYAFTEGTGTTVTESISGTTAAFASGGWKQADRPWNDAPAVGKSFSAVYLKSAGVTGLTLNSTSVLFDSTVTPNISQATHATTAHTFTVQAGNVTTGTGSDLALSAGAGSVARGNIVFTAARMTMGTNALDFPAYVAPGSPSTNIPPIAGQSFQMGGTVASPTLYQPVWSIYPRDTTLAPWSLGVGATSFPDGSDPDSLATIDYTMGLGYNLNNAVTTEPRMGWIIEHDYEQTAPANLHQSEAYFQWQAPSASGAYGCRPFFTVMDRATPFVASTLMEFGSDLGANNSSGGSLSIQGRSTAHAGGFIVAQFRNDEVSLRTNSFFIRDEAGVVSVLINSGASVSLKLPVELYDNSLSFRSTCTAPAITQNTHATTAHTFTIQAANVTTGTGSDLVGTSGTGSVAAGNVILQTGGTAKLTITPTLTTSANSVAIGSTTSATGALRFANASTVNFRNAANSADIPYFYSDSSNNIGFGSPSTVPGLYFQSTGGSFFYAGSIIHQFNANGMTLDVAATGTVGFGQAARSTDALPNNLTLTPSAAWASATTTNRTSGSLVVALAAPTNSGTVEARLKVTRGGSLTLSAGTLDGNTNYTGLWLGQPGFAPSASNFAIASNGTTSMYFNTETGGTITFGIGGGSTGAGAFTSSATGLVWSEISTLGLLQATRTTDALPGNFTISPQGPYASATGANQIGGNLVVGLAAPVGGNTSESRLIIKRGASFAAAIGPYEGAGTSYSAIWLGPGLTVTNSNYFAASNGGTSTLLNSPSIGGTFSFAFAGGANWSLSSTTLTNINVANAPIITQTANSTDAVCHDFTLAPQAAFATSTGANRKPGDFVIALGTPQNSGTTEGTVRITRGGTQLLSFGTFTGATSSGVVWCGNATPSTTNWCFASDGTANSYLNGVSAVVLTMGAASAGAGAATFNTSGLSWDKATGAISITHAAKTTDVATANLTIAPQAAFATATTTNRLPGSLVVALGAPTNSGTAEASLRITRGGTFAAQLGPLDGSGSTFSALYLGPGITPSTTNYSIVSDGSSNTYLNSPASGGAFNLAFAGTVKANLYATQWILGAALASFSFYQADTTTNGATGALTIHQAQNATGTTSTGGTLQLQSGTGTTSAGAVTIYNGATPMLNVAPFALAGQTAFSSLYFGSAAPGAGLSQLETNGGGNTMWIQAQTSILAGSTGGKLNLIGGECRNGHLGSLSGTGGGVEIWGGAGTTASYVKIGTGGPAGFLALQLSDNGSVPKIGAFNTTPVTRSTVSGALSGSPTLATLTGVVQLLVAALGNKAGGVGWVNDTTT